MILFGCLLAFSAAVAPRLVLILAWIFSDRWPRVWEGDFVLPLLGIIFLPYTTIMYMLTVTLAVGGGVQPLQGWDWLWIALGLFLDFMKWSQTFANRKVAQEQVVAYYPSGEGQAAAAAVVADEVAEDKAAEGAIAAEEAQAEIASGGAAEDPSPTAPETKDDAGGSS
jgi:hypothetical protein